MSITMTDIDWEALKSPCPKQAWYITSRQLSKDLFESKMIAVPKIQEALSYKLLTCFTKPEYLADAEALSEDSDFYLMGSAVDLMSITDDPEAIDLLDVNESSQSDLSWNGSSGEKVVKFELMGLTKEAVDWSSFAEGDLIYDGNKLVSNPSSPNRRKIYVLTSVLYASEVRIQICVHGEEFRGTVKVKIPVAFSYTKFPVDSIGIVKPAIRLEDGHGIRSTFSTEFLRKECTANDVMKTTEDQNCAVVDPLVEHIKRSGLPLLLRKPTPNDGNCWWHAVADQIDLFKLTDKPRKYWRLRQEVCDYIPDCPHASQWIEVVFDNSPEELRRFIQRQRHDGTWTDDYGIMCQATALYVGRNIRLVGTANIGQDQSYTKLEAGEEADTLPPFYIGYYQDKHYQSLELVDS